MKVSIGNDHGGCNLAISIIKTLDEGDVNMLYYGAFSPSESVDYPDYAKRVANDVVMHKSELGILICKSGVGMCIAANKIPGIRAVNCNSKEIARLSREHNDANILCLGSDFVSKEDAKAITNIFIKTKFSAGRHSQRLHKIEEIENLLKNDK